MITFRALLATGALLGFAGTAQAQDAFAVTGIGENFAVRYAPDYRGNVLGGGSTNLRDGGESLQIHYPDVLAPRPSAGIPAFVGGKEGDILYRPLPVGSTTMAADRR
ncbi:MAG TPA: hypothetical protein VNZ61_15160 [Roseomonas sp.]|nr:hypothetical protein [Roseomonas sp.]